jgi:hypothetical protein
MLYVLLPPEWLRDKDPSARPLQIESSLEEVLDFNELGYNVYYYPNPPAKIENIKQFVKARDISKFQYVFADLDMKHGKYESKAAFTDILLSSKMVPSRLVDSGGGIHAYWKVLDLDALSFLRLTRRICRAYNTDEAVSQIKQLMRVPGTLNMKIESDPRLCQLLDENNNVYTCEQLDKLLPPITKEDEEFCQAHYKKAYEIAEDIVVNDRMPVKFAQLIANSDEAKDIWLGNTDDRSSSDFRLGHLMFASGFTKDDAMSVLVNSQKALERGPRHRISYAANIVDKIWTFELSGNSGELNLSSTVKQILERGGETLKGTRFACHKYIDATEYGFRLGQVIGLVAGSGVGKTAMALNIFQGFLQNNPEYEHFFIPLEQPANEIADRWKTMCQGEERLYEKVHVLSNYDENGGFRHLSFDEIKDYILKFQNTTGKKVGCIVLDHIGALKKKGREGENQDLMDICHQMKAFAVQTNTLLVMQSQTSREKAGIGDLEIGKDSAYGTVFFESYVDYLITIWQPLKRCYSDPACPTVTAFKFCKIRHKKQGKDKIKEDVCYYLFFDPSIEKLRDLTQEEEKAFNFFLKQATNKRKLDRKTDLIAYTSAPWETANGKADSNQNSTRT